ncbi:MAG: cytochrome c3 family protein [Gemmatimonadaceae bacterium]
MIRATRRSRSVVAVVLIGAAATLGCDRESSPANSPTPPPVAELPDAASPHFRNVDLPTSYVGDAACSSCHAAQASAYRQNAMAQSFHPWNAKTRIEPPLAKPLYHAPTGYSYTVEEKDGRSYQVEYIVGPNGGRLHELRRRMDYVMGSGKVALSYFTAENGRLFQLPLTWYRAYGWDFSPGYQISNGRFGRLMPDKCVACHSSYPKPIPFVEGKYAEVRPGIGCERCHGPGALHVAERTAAVRRDTTIDNSIVNPRRLSLARRLETCEQCHVHTSVSVLREGRDAFSYIPSQPLRDHTAFFKVNGQIDIVSHAERLRESRCFIASQATARPLECATCHDPHLPPPTKEVRNQPCQSCHANAVLQKKLATSASRADHASTSDCVSCHMPRTDVPELLHGAFTDHWIRARAPGAGPDTTHAASGALLEPYFARDRAGPDARIYQAMGEILYATLANDARVMRDGAAMLDAALGTDSSRGDALFLSGIANQQIGMNDQAIRALELSVRLDSARPDRLRALAQAYSRAHRAAADVDRLYQRALHSTPQLAWLRADYADFLQGQGANDRAIEQYRVAVAEQPSLSVAWFNLGAVLAGAGQLEASARAFREAVHLDPSFAQGLSPLVQIRTRGSAVAEMRPLGSPLASLPLRERKPGAVRVDVVLESAGARLVFTNLAPRLTARIYKPDGTVVRALPADERGSARWDLLSDAGDPVDAGLYRVQVNGIDASGRPLTPRLLYLGVVRQRI